MILSRFHFAIALLLSTVASLKLATSAQFRHIPKSIIVSEIEGYISSSENIVLTVQASQSTALLTTAYSFFLKPKIVIHFPDNDIPLEITCSKMKFHHVFKDYVFEGNVVLKRGSQVLKTDFLRFDSKNYELSSFDKYTFSSGKHIVHGQAFHGMLKKHLLTLYGLPSKNHFKKIDLSNAHQAKTVRI
ncbi:MAG: hypothetical protein HYS98_02225 [Deltaproteobacteria bacterium]|nr:hypothetical protein [Deltaproteobacteria bacterium]